MKRILPILIVICIIGALFTCLPKSSNEEVTLSSLEDLSGKAVGIQSGTGYEQYLSERCPNATPVFFNEFSSIYPALTQGKIDVMLSETISFAVEKTEIPSLVALEEPITSLDYSIGVSQSGNGNTIYAQLNDFIEKSKSDGTLDSMKSYWLDDYDRKNATVDKSGITGEKGELTFSAEASFEPMCFAGKGGELIGYNVDFIYRFCREYGYSPKIDTLDYDSMVTALAGGKCSVAVGIIPDEERAEEVNFTNSLLDFGIIAVYDNQEQSNTSFFTNLINSFNKTFIRDDRYKMFLEGAANTLLISALSVIFGSLFGLLLYLWCSHGKKAEQKATNVLCWLMSSTPTVVLLMILYYIIFSQYLISNIAVAVIGFSVLFGCGFYERIVSGVNAVGNGQLEAARAQGFTADQAFFRIIFPQAAEHFMPSYQGDIIALIQETSVVGYIAIKDLTKMSDLVRGRTYEAFFPLLATAGIYFLLIWILTGVLNKIAVSLNHKNRTEKRILKGIVISKDKENKDV